MNSTKPGIFSLSYPGLLLGLAVLLSTSLLAMGHLATRDAIAQRLAEDLIASLDQVLPPAGRDNDLLAAPLTLTREGTTQLTVYRAEQQRQISAVAFRVTAAEGYGGPIQLLVGIDAQGQILGVRTLAHAETPGLGDKIETAKSDWITHFNGYSLDNLPLERWAVKKDGGQFDQFTGATVTPRAVVKGVKQALQLYQQQQTTLLQPRPAAALPTHSADNRQPTHAGADS